MKSPHCRPRSVAVRLSSMLLAFTAWLPMSLLPADDTVDLAQLARRQREQVTPVADDHLAEARAALEQAMREVNPEELQRRNPDWKAWREMLRWEELEQAAAGEEPDIPHLQSLSEVFRGTVPGMEHESLQRVRARLEAYIGAAIVAAEPDPAAAARLRLEQLAELLEAPRSERDQDAIRPHLAWLRWAGQAEPLTRAASEQARRPNIVISVRRDAALLGLADLRQQFNDTRFASHVIVGTPVSGEVHTRGTVDAELRESEGGVSFLLNLQGESFAPRNRAVHPPVTLISRSRTALAAAAEITWDGRRLSATPVRARCSTESTILGAEIDRRRLIRRGQGGLLDRLIERAAYRRAGARMPQARYEGNRIAEREISARMNEMVAEALREANEQIDEMALRPMLRIGAWAETQFSTTTNYLNFSATRGDAAGLAADSQPQFDALDQELAFCVHESAPLNFAGPLLAGATWTDKQFSDLQRQVLGDRTYEMRIGLHPRWALTFDWLQPITTRFHEEGIDLAIRAESFTLEGEKHPHPFRLDARYTLTAPRGFLRFARRDDLRLTWNDGTPTGGRRQELEQFITRYFGGFLLQEFYPDGLALPAGGAWDSIRAWKVEEIQARQGWLYVQLDNTATPLGPEHPLAQRGLNADLD